MLQRVCGKIQQDKIRNKNTIESDRVAPIVEKMMKNRLSWFEHVVRKHVIM